MQVVSETVEHHSAAQAANSTFLSLALRPACELQRCMNFEARAARLTLPKMQQLQEQHPLWTAHYDDVEPDTADIEQLYGLLESAPNDFAAGLVYGKLSLRAQIAAVSGRSF